MPGATAVAPGYGVTGENRAGSRLADRGRDVRAIRARATRARETRGNGSRLGHTDVRHPNTPHRIVLRRYEGRPSTHPNTVAWPSSHSRSCHAHPTHAQVKPPG